MEKLIELYNKHLQDRGLTHKCVEWEVRENINMLDQLKLFVKRLVEQDKIELEAGPLYGCQLIMHNRQPYTLYETLLMLLAISDTPIEDLISYLK